MHAQQPRVLILSSFTLNEKPSLSHHTHSVSFLRPQTQQNACLLLNFKETAQIAKPNKLLLFCFGSEKYHRLRRPVQTPPSGNCMSTMTHSCNPISRHLFYTLPETEGPNNGCAIFKISINIYTRAYSYTIPIHNFFPSIRTPLKRPQKVAAL